MFQDFVQFCGFLIVSPIIYFVALPIVFSILVFNEFIRYFFSIYLRLRHGKDFKLCPNGQDAIWEFKISGNTRTVLISNIASKGQLDDMEKIIGKLNTSLFENTNQYEKLKNIIIHHRATGYICMKKDTKFNIRNHVRSLDKNITYNDQEVMNIFSGLCKDMDESKPQWEWILIPKILNTQGDEKSLIVFRYHHFYMDGISILMMMKRLSTSYEYMLNPLKFKIPLWKKIFFYTNCIIYGPVKLVQLILNKYNHYWILNSPFPGEKKVFAWSQIIDLDKLKSIRFDSRATIPNILANAFVNAVNKVLPAERIVKEIRVAELLAFLPYPNTMPQNRFSAFSYSIRTDEPCSYEKLKKTQVEALGAISGPQPLLYFYTFKLIGRMPTWIWPIFFAGSQDSIFLSNVPCAKSKFTWIDLDCEEFGAFPPFPNDTGICISSLSYANGLKLCGQADSSWLTQEELNRIFEEIPKEIDNLSHMLPEYSHLMNGNNKNSNSELDCDREKENGKTKWS